MLQDPRLPGVCIDQSEPWHRAFREHLLEIIAPDQKKPEFYEPQNVQENSPDYDRLRSILSYIEENYRNPITLKDISGHIHLCESECTRLFKRHMNTNLFTYLQEYRIERSLEDLCKGNASNPMDCLKKHFRHLAFALCHQVRLKEVRMWQIISVLEAYPVPVTQNRYCLLVGWKNIIAL